MVLKKPYGLLIKHFKLIHFILTILTVYLAYRTRTIVTFFSDYVANNYSVTITDNLVSSTISPFIYIFIFLVLITLVALYILLRYKKKPNKAYLVAIIYYVLLFLMILIAAYLIGSLNDGFWETASARQYRDFAQLIYWPQYIFILILGIRSLGFNIKKFNFKDDIKELELSEEDSELIEINLGFDIGKIERIIRRIIREFMYYFKENKFIFICVASVVVLILGYLLFTGYEKIHYSYTQGKAFVYNNFKFKVEDSIITNLNYDGNIINDDKYYVLVKLSVTNNGKEDKAIDYSNFKIYIGNDYYYPTLDMGSHFVDYAKPYYGEKIKVDETKTVLFTYIIDKKYINRSFKITIYNGVSLKKKNFVAKTITVKLNPIIIDDVVIVKTASLNEEVSFEGTYLNDTNLTIKDSLITNKYTYTYETCYKEICKEYVDSVVMNSTSQNKKTLLVLGYEFNLDSNSSYYASVKSISGFIDHFVKVRYSINGSVIVADIKNITPVNLNNKLVLEIPKEVEEAQEMDLFITIRNKSYVFSLTR